ncbi:MAG: DNA cytosine methyltransferase, partial [Candidatus Kryptoniota bacterium]
MQEEYTYIDLFAGCGGLSLGLLNAGWEGLFAIEKSPDAFATLKHNLIEKKKHFDWPTWLPQTDLDINRVIKEYSCHLRRLQGKVDMVVGGPPCQGFSMAGRRKQEDKRNHLIKSYIQFVKLVRPKLIFFENVKGFTQEFKKGRTKGKRYSGLIERALEGAGYVVQDELLNFAHFGIPQSRTRFILVGVRSDLVNGRAVNAESFFQRIRAGRSRFLSRKALPINAKLGSAISDLLQSNGVVPSQDSKGFENGVYGHDHLTPYQRVMREGVHGDAADSHRFARHTEGVVSKFKFILRNAGRNKKIGERIRKKYQIKKHRVVPLQGDLPPIDVPMLS